MGYIYFLSAQQTTGIKGDPQITLISIFWQRFIILKSFHLIEYGVLLILLYFVVKNWKKAYLIGYLYALSDEFHQHFTPGRTSKLTDTFIDLLGMTLGFLAFSLLQKMLKKSTNRKL